MKTYIALLRGINVSGQKKIKMADLRDLLESEGLKNVRTYIQSGNVIFESRETAKALQEQIKSIIAKQYGFEVPILIRTPEEITQIIENNPFMDDESKDPTRTYFTILSGTPEAELVSKVQEKKYASEEVVFGEHVIYFHSPLGYGDAKMNNNFFEKKLKVSATTRNWKTLNKLIEMTG